MVDTYPFAQIEAKWQKYWAENQQFKATEDSEKPKYYQLEMFPYPSGRIHMGHVRNYSIGDVMSRYQIMHGYNVIHPMGWDAFGLPAENAAIDRDVHPAEWTYDNITTMKAQLMKLGISYDWDREVATCSPDYYRWGQWMFLKLYERGLAYRKDSPANWCEDCNTVLADEEAEGGTCWRCGSAVVKRIFGQWFFKITEYADELLDMLGELPGWPERVLTMQRDWIGKSIGAEIDFPLAERDGVIKVFTTRPDTVYGATYMVLAPEHPLVAELVAQTKKEAETMAFVEEVSRMEKEIRTAADIEKKGMFIGAYCINPFTEEEIPIWIADYVLLEYGTGAIMAVPAHDDRDFDFAKKHELPIRAVIQPPGEELDGDTMKEAYIEPGVMANSGPFNGLDSTIGIQKITDYMAEINIGRHTVSYHLRDWGVSRQRYWGNPIPVIHCDDCGIVPVPYSDLPVILPEEVKFLGSGRETLMAHQKFYEVDCPECGKTAPRETDTMSTFVDSAWYFARYIDPKNEQLPFGKDKASYWLPVDHYVGGIEHAVMHLLYARFFTKVMRDIGLLAFDEPFTKLLTQGMVCKESYRCEEHNFLFEEEVVFGDGEPKCAQCGRTLDKKNEKMSKSKNNVVDPDDIITEYGADTMRMFMLFTAPPERDLDWSEKGVEGSSRRLNRIWRIFHRYLPQIEDVSPEYDAGNISAEAQKLRRVTHETIKQVSIDIEERLHFNTAISRIDELVNVLYQISSPEDETYLSVLRESIESLVLLLSPFAPHIAEELWEKLGKQPSILKEPWPQWDEAALEVEEILLIVQVNGKLRSRIHIPADATDDDVRQAALQDERIQKYIAGKDVKRVVVVPKRLANIVV